MVWLWIYSSGLSCTLLWIWRKKTPFTVAIPVRGIPTCSSLKVKDMVVSILEWRGSLLLQSVQQRSSLHFTILGAGKFIKPKLMKRFQLDLECFDLSGKEWVKERTIQVQMEETKFSLGAFRDAFKALESGSSSGSVWVVKKYNDNSKKIINVTVKSTTQKTARKQKQMHTVARDLTLLNTSIMMAVICIHMVT